MNRFLKYRVLPLVLAISVSLSLLVVPSKAASSVGGQIAAGNTTLTEAVGDYASFFEGVRSYVTECEFGGATTPFASGVSMYTRISDSSNIFDVGSVENLHDYATAININNVGLSAMVSQTGTGPNDYYYIQYVSVVPFGGGGFDRDSAISGLKITYTAADENGLILVASVASAGAVEGQWLPYKNTLPQDITTYQSLDALRLSLQENGVNCSLTKMDVGYVLTKSTGTPPYYVTEAYCNAWGAMYVAPADDRVVTGDRVHIDGDGNQINIGIDFDGGTINLPDGAELELNQVIFDDSTNTYYVDAEDDAGTVYNYQFVYNIDYTSITYIGQTAEYNKYYEVYYELPDGRSSADLTAEELEQLNISIDMVPYDRAVDDTSLRGLYHFDGDIGDASYWNYATGFSWSLGASIVYMDAGTFGGALYMDESNHSFDITLPAPLSTGDFTIQWRYYQSYTASAASAPDGYVSFGSNDLMSWDGVQFYTGLNGAALADTPTGQWMELALIREAGTIYYYVNGLCVGSAANTSSLGKTLTFGFGALQQTWKYFDELRILNKALVSGGEDYTPTSVPHDTNLTLVLPDPDSVAVADEYWIFNDTGNLLEHYDFTNNYDVEVYATAENFAMSGYSTAYSSDSTIIDGGWHYGVSSGSGAIRSDLVNCGTYVQVVGNAGADSNGDPMIYYPVFEGNTAGTSAATYYTEIVDGLSLASGDSLTGTIVLSDGSQYSVTHAVKTMGKSSNGYSSYSNTFIESVSLPNGAVLGFYCVSRTAKVSLTTHTYPCVMLALTVPEGQTLDVVYAELVSGNTANSGHEFVSNIIGVDGKELDKVTLAVRTDQEITGYQIGGVRPSIPTKGLVWALVESGVIKSIQIYTGSAWEAVDGRIWTGTRWVPYSAYDVLLMKDLYDINGIVTSDDYEYIYTEEGFWSWWQKSWLDFVAWIKGNNGGEGDGASSDQTDDSIIPPVTDDDDGTEWKFIDLLVVLKDGAWNIGKGIVVTVFDGISGLGTAVEGIGGFFNSFSPGGDVFQIYEVGEGIWD